ncbi:MAG: spidroin-2 [Desulfovibrio sp.]|nr:spidroin-2 [Desulfovibrio sp.]
MTPDPALILWHWCAALLGIAANAAATLPLMAALALILGRRGHAALCLRGAAALAGLGLWLSAAWPALVIGDALVQLSRAGEATAATRFAAFFTPAGAGISLSVAVWLTGMGCAFLGRYACARAAAALPPGAESYSARNIRLPLTALFAAAACALAAYALRNWPFAGLPPGMDAGRAAGAVLKHAFRAYFAALASGGATGLLLAAAAARRGSFHGPLTAAEAVGCLRWCAVWAVAGCVPQLLERWGVALGLLLRGGAPAVPGNPHAVLFQLVALVVLTLACAAWAVLLVRREPLRRLRLAPAGLALLILAVSAPPALALIFR